ncbi:MAG: hemolysin III family protein [Ruminococcaceae bacterium]|nr:hemolysin III family protein [Oscillospiraceae bacterium]
MKKRTKLSDRQLPDYTRGEELVNTITHVIGGGLGVAALTLCVIWAAIRGDAWAVVSSAVYGASLVILYAMSSIYHGLKAPLAKKVFQVLDHCAIYFLIAGTYTPVLLCSVRRISPGWAWAMFGVVWGLAALATTLNAIDLDKYEKFSMACYIGMGWCIVIAAKVTIAAVPFMGLLYILIGGVAYTVGAVLFVLGEKIRYMHSMFHLFVVAGSVLHFLGIFFYII